MKEKKLLILLLLFTITLSTNTQALEGTHLITNSEDWKDVYSTMLYAKLTDRGASFLTSTTHGPVLLQGLSKSNSIGIITSEDRPFVIGYPAIVRSEGFQNTEELEVDSANLELIEENELEEIENFIVVSDAYGYNAVAVAPYAVQTNAWVFIANRINIAEIENILQGRNINNLLLYGYLEEEVRETLEQFNPTTINEGDRFKDNIEIVKEYININPTQQVTLTNGEFFEQEVISGKYPILFTGRQNVPEPIGEYLKESDITVGVLVGNELIQAATNIRRSTGISVMVKFARSGRSPGAGVSQVEGLDLFPLPAPQLTLSVDNIRYNQATTQLEVTYKSDSNVPLYLKGTITLDDGEETQRVGDTEAIYMAPGDYKTITYKDITVGTGSLTAEYVTLFGEVETALDRQLQGETEVSLTTIIDKCEIEVEKILYIKQDEQFYVKIDNKEEVDCYVDIEFHDIEINNIPQIIGTDGSKHVKAKKTEWIPVEQRMTEQDLEDNQFINIEAYYGEREDALVKQYKGKYELHINRFNSTTFYTILLLILLIIIIITIYILKKRNEEWM